MSSSTSTTNPTIHAPDRNSLLSLSTRNSRSLSADDAPGFAQVLRSHEPADDAGADALGQTDEIADSEPKITEQETEPDPDNADDQTGQSGEQNQTDSDDAGEPEEILPVSGQSQGDDDTVNTRLASPENPELSPQQSPQGDPSIASNQNTQAVQGHDAVTKETDATTSKQAASLDLLVNRGDQAKLSIRGLVQSLRAQVAPDLTATAVQTRLGQTPQQSDLPSDQGTQQDIKPSVHTDKLEPDFAHPGSRQSAGGAGRNPGDSLSDRPPTSPRNNAESTPNAQVVNASDIKPVHVADLSGADAQVARSTRADAPQPIQNRAPIDLTRTGAIASDGASNGRVDGALTARAISGVAAGSGQEGLRALGDQAPKAGQLSDSQPSSTRASVLAQVQRGLASLLRSGNGDMTLKLTPSHLGTVQISIKRDGDRVSLRMTASSDDARDLLRAGAKDLTQVLHAKGVKVENMRIDLQQQDSPNPGEQSSEFGDGRNASHDQNNAQDGATRDPRGDGVVPLVDQGDGPALDEPKAYWSELGLDAIA